MRLDVSFRFIKYFVCAKCSSWGSAVVADTYCGAPVLVLVSPASYGLTKIVLLDAFEIALQVLLQLNKAFFGASCL